MILAEMRAGGIVRAALEELDDVPRWRAAARRAGRLLGWHVRTGVSGDWAWAASEDWEAPASADRDAAALFAALICDGTRRGGTSFHVVRARD